MSIILHRKDEFLVWVFNFKVKYCDESTGNQFCPKIKKHKIIIPKRSIFFWFACVLESVNSFALHHLCAFHRLQLQAHIKLLSVRMGKYSTGTLSVLCMTLLECFKFDLIYWMFLGIGETSAQPKRSSFQSIGFQRTFFHSHKI